MPLRPIVAGRGSIFSGLTKELGRIVGPLVGNTQHHIRDSVDLVDKLKGETIPPGYSLCSWDLVNMYTKIPKNRALELLETKLKSDSTLNQRTPLRTEEIMALVKLDLDLAYFRYNGNFYSQIEGLSMGKSTSSPLSDIYMEEFEAHVNANYPTGDNNTSPKDIILFWYRKADDTITAIRNDHIDTFHTYLNSIHPAIKWTKEVEQNGRIAMLDVQLIRNSNGSIDFDVYRKPTHTNQYIPFDSHQPLAHKLSTVHSLTRRATLIPSTEELKQQEMERVKEALTINGYPKWAFDKARYRPPPPPPPPPSDDPQNPPTPPEPSSSSSSTSSSSSSPKKRLGIVTEERELIRCNECRL